MLFKSAPQCLKNVYRQIWKINPKMILEAQIFDSFFFLYESF